MPPAPPRRSCLTALTNDVIGVFQHLSTYFSNFAIYSISYWKPWPTELQGQEPVSRKFFGWHNSLCIFKTKVSWGTKLCTYFYFSSLYNIWKDQLYRISRLEFFDFRETGPRTGVCHGYCPVAQLVEQGWSIPQVVGSNPTLVRLFLCPCVGTFPLQGLMLRGDKLGISKHCKLPINYLDLLIISATRSTF